MRKPRIVFLKIIFLTIILIVCSNAKAQLFIGSKEDFTANPQKGDHAYTIYWYPFSDYMLKHLHINEKIITEKGEVENGLIKRIFYFEGSKHTSTEIHLFKYSLLVKSISTSPKLKYAEIFDYSYDPITKEQIFTKGTKNGKLIYSVIKTHLKDSIIEKRIYNDELLKVKEKEVTYYSPDSLIQTNLLFINGQKASKHIKNYVSKNIIAEEIDSSVYEVRKEKYIYDTLGRLSEKRSYRNSEPQNITEYKYEHYQTTISNYPFYDSQKGQISKEHLSLYDKNAILVYEQTIEYDKPEGIVAPPGSKQILLEPIVEPGLIIMKSYHQNRLVQVQINHGDEIGNCYEIQYR